MSEIKLQLSETRSAGPPGPLATASATDPVDLQSIAPLSSTNPTLSLSPEIAQALQLSPTEQQHISDLTQQINLQDSVATASYGEAIQKQLRHYTDDALKSAAECSTSDIGTLLQSMSSAIQRFNDDLPADPSSGFGASRRAKLLRAKYDETAQLLNHIDKELTGWIIKLNIDVKVLDRMYQQILDHYKQLDIYIQAGQQKLSAVRRTELPELQQIARTTNHPSDTLAYRDLDQRCQNFEKRLQDLEVTQTIFLQSAVQTQLVRMTDQQLINSIQSSLSNSISAWQQSIATALATKQSREAFQLSNGQLLTAIDQALTAQKAERHSREGITNLQASLPTR